ncbi:MAG: hypothetical protein GFGODING_02832 [Flavobacteriales bacterium]|nr:hypothetical protein [Flavobacteriales bacterium]
MHAALAVLLVLATSVPVLSRMTCLEGGHSRLMVGDSEDCCPTGEDTEGATVKAQCCVTTTAQAARDAYVPTAALAMATADDGALPTPPLVVMAAERTVVAMPGTRPPPLPVLERLARLQVLRI